MGGLLGGAKGMLAPPLSNYGGGPGPPLPTPMERNWPYSYDVMCRHFEVMCQIGF